MYFSSVLTGSGGGEGASMVSTRLQFRRLTIISRSETGTESVIGRASGARPTVAEVLKLMCWGFTTEELFCITRESVIFREGSEFLATRLSTASYSDRPIRPGIHTKTADDLTEVLGKSVMTYENGLDMEKADSALALNFWAFSAAKCAISMFGDDERQIGFCGMEAWIFMSTICDAIWDTPP